MLPRNLVLSNNPDHLLKVGGQSGGTSESDAPAIQHGAMDFVVPPPGLDIARMRRHRLAAVRKQMHVFGFDALLLFDPLNTRYAVDATNQSVRNMHIERRCVLIPLEGRVTLFDWTAAPYLSEGIREIEQLSVMDSYDYIYCGSVSSMQQQAGRFADEVVARLSSGTSKLAADRMNFMGVAALKERGFDPIYDGQAVTEHARSIKSDDEIIVLKRVIEVTQEAMAMMNEATDSIGPDGITENALWAILQQHNVASGGQWIETRLLAAGKRTNPWFQESSGHLIHKGDMISFDTDLVGPYGYCADVSRAWVAGNKVTKTQQDLYKFAVDQVLDNMSRVQAGASFEYLAKTSWDEKIVPNRFFPNRYSCPYHGVGLCDEYPSIPYGGQDWDEYGYAGELKSGMVISVESYIGEVGGDEGVKVEEMVLVTDDGYEQLSDYPWDKALYPDLKL